MTDPSRALRTYVLSLVMTRATWSSQQGLDIYQMLQSWRLRPRQVDAVPGSHEAIKVFAIEVERVSSHLRSKVSAKLGAGGMKRLL